MKSEEIVCYFAPSFYHSEVGGNIPVFCGVHGKMNHQRSKVSEKSKLILFPKIEEPSKIYMTKDEEKYTG